MASGRQRHSRIALQLVTLLLLSPHPFRISLHRKDIGNVYSTATVSALRYCSMDILGDDGTGGVLEYDGDNNGLGDISGSGFCPDRNTCCPTSQPGISACVTQGVESTESGVCCFDDGGGVYKVPTGCAPGFYCSSSFPSKGGDKTQNDRLDEMHFFCRKDSSKESSENQIEIEPRYHLCTLSAQQLGVVHGLPISTTSSKMPTLRQAKPLDNNVTSAPNLAYFSTMGSLTSPSTLASHKSIRQVIIAIHGSGRNADDYLCSASVIPYLQTQYNPNSILVLAPWFIAPTDPTNTTLSFPPNALRWDDVGGPIPHTFRYGADDSYRRNVSSYQAMDEMVEALIRDVERFPWLERIVVVGHSAGGQFVQRWALTSSSIAWNDDKYNTKQHWQYVEKGVRNKGVEIVAIVANPRSFAYLDARRFINGTFQLPPKDMRTSCPGYDEWEWGLKPGGPLGVPYVSKALSSISNVEEIINRYMQRNVVYLAGAKDNTTVRAGCEDDNFQGRSRLERSANFFASLKMMYGEEKVRHSRLVVDGVGHDHALMFQSGEALEAMFGDYFEGREMKDYTGEVQLSKQ